MYKTFSPRKRNEDENCNHFSSTISTDSEMYSHGSYFNFPCRITSCVCRRKVKRRNLQDSKITKIFPAYNKKEYFSKTSSEENFNEFSRSEIFRQTNVKNSASPPCKCTENLNKTPINIQLSMDSAGNTNSPLTFVVDVPSTVLEVLQKRSSDINNSKSFTVLKRARSLRSKTGKTRSLKSVFCKLLRNKTAKSYPSTSTLKSSSFENSDIFSSDREIRENTVKNRSSYNSFPVFSDFSQINIAHRTSDVLHTDFCTSDVEKISTDNSFEKKCHHDKTENKMRDKEQRKLTLDELYTNFLKTQFNKEWNQKLKSEEENTSFSRCKRNSESPIDIKIRKFPLLLKKSHHSDKTKTELQNEFLQKLVKNLPKEPSDKRLVNNKRKFESQVTFLTDDKDNSIIKTSTLEYLLQNLADVRKTEVINLKQPVEKDWYQALSTRQLSKISLCSSGSCSCSVKDEYESGVIEINEEDENEKSDIKLSITAKLYRLVFNVFGR